jgi:hypothetical protein
VEFVSPGCSTWNNEQPSNKQIGKLEARTDFNKKIDWICLRGLNHLAPEIFLC